MFAIEISEFPPLISNRSTPKCLAGHGWVRFSATGISFWRHQMEIFSALLAFCAGNSPVTGEFSAQRPVRRSFDVFFDLLLNKRLSKQSRRGWFETPSRSLWRHCNVFNYAVHGYGSSRHRQSDPGIWLFYSYKWNIKRTLSNKGP